jgi:hypothetical protein
MMPILAAVLAAAVMVAAPGSSTAGAIFGCVSDTMRQRLPGATVVVKKGALQRNTVADSAGCYELNNLPPASYRVTARLAGFDNVTRDRVVVAHSTLTRLDFTTRPSAICECVHVAGTLGELSDRAAAVLHVRLSDSEAASSTPQGYYHVGQELVAFLESSNSNAFHITNNYVTGGLDPSLVFLVHDDRIQRAPSEFSRYVGMPIGLFLEELRTPSRDK